MMATASKTSPRGIVALVLHEGIVPGPYLDSASPPVWSYGIGHTAAAGAPDPSRMARGMPADLTKALQSAIAVFRADLPKYEAEVRAAVKVQLSQHEFDALVSFHFNTGAIERATLVKQLNAGKREAAASGFMTWKKPTSIIDRRRAEQRLFRDGVYPTGRATVWGVTATGQVKWNAQQRLTDIEMLAMVGAA